MNNNIDILNATPLSRILDEFMHGTNNIYGDSNKWKLDNEHIIVLNEWRWFDFMDNKGGNGPISLMSYCLKLKGYSDTEEIRLQTLAELNKLNEKLLLKIDLENNLAQQPHTPQRKI